MIAAVEFFFRGFLLFPLHARWGRPALVAVAVPYCLVHLGKPAVELYGSFVFGVVLAYLAVRSGSILHGIAIHWAFAAGLFVWPLILP